METQVKQRVAGILVLLVLVVAIAFLLFFGTKNGKGNAGNVEKPANDTMMVAPDNADMQMMPPAENAANATANTTVENPGISLSPKDVVPNKPAESQPAISDEFGKLPANNANENPQSAAVAPLIPPSAPEKSIVDQEIKSEPQVTATEEMVAAKPIKSPAKALVKKPVVKKPVVKKHAKLKAKMKAKPAIHVAAGGFAVQLASFSSPEHAKNLQKNLTAKGYHSYTKMVTTKNHGVLTQLFVGPLADKQKAAQLVVTLENEFKLKGIVVHSGSKHKKVKLTNNPVKA